jgi:ribosomal protein S25
LGGKPTAEPQPKPRRRVAAKKGSRAREALKLVHAEPGITPPKVAKRMKMKSPSYAYKVLGDLAATGAIRKDGTGFVPAGHGEASAA